MLAFELPPNEIIAVEYFGLARQSDLAEIQKDYLRQALGAIVPSADFVDAGDDSESSRLFGIFVRCLQCAMQPGNAPLAISAVQPARGFSSGSSNASRYSVKISTQKGLNQFWNIEVGQRRVSWYATLRKNTVSSSTRVSAKNFDLKSCINNLNCPRVSLFESEAACQQELEKHFGKRVNIAASERFKNNKSEIFSDNLVYQNDVRSQTFIRAHYQSKGSPLSIRMNVRALRNGSFGDIIPIELKTPTASGRSVRQLEARIIGEGEVEIVR